MRGEVPVGPKIYRIRTDVLWEDVLRNSSFFYSGMRGQGEGKGGSGRGRGRGRGRGGRRGGGEEGMGEGR